MALVLAGAAAGGESLVMSPCPGRRGGEGRAEPVAYLRSQLSPAGVRGRLRQPWDSELRGGSPRGSGREDR